MKETTMEITENDKHQLPSFLKNETCEDTQLDVNKEDLKISQLKLAHPISDDVVDGLVKTGDFYDSITKKNYGKEVEIIVLKHEKTWLKFSKKKKLIARSNDGKFWDNGEELSEDEKWSCFSHTFYILVGDDLQPFPMSLSFKSTSKKEGDNLLTFLHKFAVSEKKPIFSWIIKLESEQVDGEKGKFCVQKANPLKYVDQRQYVFAKDISEMINKASSIEVKDINQEKEEEENQVTLD